MKVIENDPAVAFERFQKGSQDTFLQLLGMELLHLFEYICWPQIMGIQRFSQVLQNGGPAATAFAGQAKQPAFGQEVVKAVVNILLGRAEWDGQGSPVSLLHNNRFLKCRLSKKSEWRRD